MYITFLMPILKGRVFHLLVVHVILEHAAIETGNDRLVVILKQIFGILRSEEHTSELQSLMRISYAVFCLKKKKINYTMSLTTITILNNSTTMLHYHNLNT